MVLAAVLAHVPHLDDDGLVGCSDGNRFEQAGDQRGESAGGRVDLVARLADGGKARREVDKLEESAHLGEVQADGALIKDATGERASELCKERSALDWVLTVAAADGTTSGELNTQHAERGVELGRQAENDRVVVPLGTAGLLKAQQAAGRVGRGKLQNASRVEAASRRELVKRLGRASKEARGDGALECRARVRAELKGRR